MKPFCFGNFESLLAYGKVLPCQLTSVIENIHKMFNVKINVDNVDYVDKL